MKSISKTVIKNELKAITVVTPVGNFHMILEVDTVRASGFGTLTVLRKRLPKTLQSVPIKKVVGADSHPYALAVKVYFEGDKKSLLKIRTMQDGGEFAQKVWKAMSKIPSGKTISYAELAVLVGNPKAVRAVGTLCGNNRLILLVPCHRVIKSDGSIGKYLYGNKIKKCLVEMEKRKMSEKHQI